MPSDFDIVVVAHKDEYYEMAEDVKLSLEICSDARYNVSIHDNRTTNIGFAPGCNEAAKNGDAPIIGFINPDASIQCGLSTPIYNAFSNPEVVITGENFGKPRWEYRMWGCEDWVCGAALFVKRDFWETVGGFDDRYLWGWEETDLIRQAQVLGKKVKSISLPIKHESPTTDTPEDIYYKHLQFNRGARLFREKWMSHLTQRGPYRVAGG